MDTCEEHSSKRARRAPSPDSMWGDDWNCIQCRHSAHACAMPLGASAAGTPPFDTFFDDPTIFNNIGMFASNPDMWAINFFRRAYHTSNTTHTTQPVNTAIDNIQSGVYISSSFSGLAPECQAASIIEDSMGMMGIDVKTGFVSTNACDWDSHVRRALVHRVEGKHKPHCVEFDVLSRLHPTTRRLVDIEVKTHRVKMRDLKVMKRNRPSFRTEMQALGLKLVERLHSVLKDAVWMEGTDGCFVHHGDHSQCKPLPRHPSVFPIEIAGSTCKDYSIRGSKKLWAGASIQYLMVWLYWVKAFPPSVFLHECTPLFDETIVKAVLGEDFVIETLVDSPTHSRKPTRRNRKWTMGRHKIFTYRLLKYDAADYGGMMWSQDALYPLSSYLGLSTCQLNHKNQKRVVTRHLPPLQANGEQWQTDLMLGNPRRRTLMKYLKLIAEHPDLDIKLVDLSQDADSEHRVVSTDCMFAMCRNSDPWLVEQHRPFEVEERLASMGWPIFSEYFTFLSEPTLNSEICSLSYWQNFIGDGMHVGHLGEKVLFIVGGSKLRTKMSPHCGRPAEAEVADAELSD